MACCSSCSTPPQQVEPEIKYPKRPVKFKEIEDHPEYKLFLQHWSKDLEASETKLARKLGSLSMSRSELYQILGLFFVFQGVILTAVAQSNLLHCNHWWLVFLLSLIAFLFATLAVIQKLKETAEYKEQHFLERKVHRSLHIAIDNLKDKGTEFDLTMDQPDLGKKYTKEDILGKGSFAKRFAAAKRFCRVWVFSYAGCMLLLLCAFSVITLIAIPLILCSPGTCNK